MSESKELVVSKADQVLGQLLDKALNGVDKAVEFSQEQIPDVVEQLLLWKMTEGLIGFIMGVIVLIAMIYVLIKYTGKGSLEEGCSMTYKMTLTHNGDGDLDAQTLITVFGSVLILMLAFHLINFDWLQIIIAPKLYLLEYAANFVK